MTRTLILILLLCISVALGVWFIGREISASHSDPRSSLPERTTPALEENSMSVNSIDAPATEMGTRSSKSLLQSPLQDADPHGEGTSDASRVVAKPFELREFRKETIMRLHARFVAAKPDSFDEWQAGYQLMLNSVHAHLDHIGAATLGNGQGFQAPTRPDTFRSYSDDREYVWTKYDYPQLAELFQAQLEAPPRPAHSGSEPIRPLTLTDSQRQAVIDLYTIAAADLK